MVMSPFFKFPQSNRSRDVGVQDRNQVQKYPAVQKQHPVLGWSCYAVRTEFLMFSSSTITFQKLEMSPSGRSIQGEEKFIQRLKFRSLGSGGISGFSNRE